jgi:hypothetical protein
MLSRPKAITLGVTGCIYFLVRICMIAKSPSSSFWPLFAVSVVIWEVVLAIALFSERTANGNPD